MEHGDQDPPWWTRSVQDHLGPRSDISRMTLIVLLIVDVFSEVLFQDGIGPFGLSVCLWMESRAESLFDS